MDSALTHDVASDASLVTDFIVENFLFGATDDAPAPGDSFLELGYIDSTAIVELIAFVEDTFSIELADDELVPDNLDSVDKITSFVQRVRSQGR